ncbi:MAG: hypothetical protein CMH54_00900 [Myxococcales bacterium]|nr:hypothetical protein [Myxococcales bacterium]
MGCSTEPEAEPQLTADDCVGASIGVIETSLGTVDYADGNLSGVAEHQIEEGCITQIQLHFERAEGCALDLTLESADGNWALTDGSFELEASCGLSGVEDSFGSFVLDSAESAAAMVGPQVVTAEEDLTCVNANALSLMGQATFTKGEESIEINLNDLALGGEIFSSRLSEAGCPGEPETCASRVCGDDEYGIDCGTCGVGYDCTNVGQCALNTCPPLAPFGTHPYNTLTDRTVYDCDGNPVQLHELCGAPAGFFNLLAGW